MISRVIRNNVIAWCIILTVIILVGCTRDVVEQDITIVADTNTYNGVYTGALEGGKPTGQAKFVVRIDDSNNWVYNGGFSDGSFAGEGSVDNYPCKIKVGVHNDEGIYSGEVNNCIANGAGAYESSLGWSYVGGFENGAIKGEGEVTAFPVNLSYENKTIEGTYDGTVIDAIPNGSGSFYGKIDSIAISYEGEWADGLISGNGTLKSNSYTILFDDGIERTGEYEGATLDGKANGEGVFTATNSAGNKYTYTGDFKDGTFDGMGEIDFESEELTDYSGHFTKGMNTPTKSELIKYIGSIKEFVEFNVTEESLRFIDDHEKLFMAENAESLEPFINKDISLNELYKTPHAYPDELFMVKTTKITQIRQEDLYDKTITWFITEDANYNRIFVVCNGALPDVNKNDKVTVYGLPIDIGSYKNAFNSVMNAYVIYGCYVTK